VVSQAQAHILRAENDAILVGIGTAVTDDPMLDCMLNECCFMTGPSQFS